MTAASRVDLVRAWVVQQPEHIAADDRMVRAGERNLRIARNRAAFDDARAALYEIERVLTERFYEEQRGS